MNTCRKIVAQQNVERWFTNGYCVGPEKFESLGMKVFCFVFTVVERIQV